MNARCALLADRYLDVQAFQCPTDQLRFHYHGAVAPEGAQAGYSRVFRGRICGHRHMSLQAAITCSERVHAGVQGG